MPDSVHRVTLTEPFTSPSRGRYQAALGPDGAWRIESAANDYSGFPLERGDTVTAVHLETHRLEVARPAVPGDTRCRSHGGKMPPALEMVAYPLEADAPMDAFVGVLVGVLHRTRPPQHKPFGERNACLVCDTLALALAQVFRKKLEAAVADAHEWAAYEVPPTPEPTAVALLDRWLATHPDDPGGALIAKARELLTESPA